MDINDLTDEELGRAADLYFARALQRVRVHWGQGEYVHLNVTGVSTDSSMKIEHKLYIGYDDKHKITANNLLHAIEEAKRRERDSVVAPPETIHLALEAPKQVEPVEYHEFAEVVDDSDGVPF